MNKDELIDLITNAFEWVTLDKGMSLRQADAADSYEELTPKQWKALIAQEITWNWQLIPKEELETYAFLAHLDANGFRYYIPAYMVCCLKESQDEPMYFDIANGLGYVNTSPWLSDSIIFYLTPDEDSWDYHMMRYSALSPQQKTAIANFLLYFPEVCRLDISTRKECETALELYWLQYLY